MLQARVLAQVDELARLPGMNVRREPTRLSGQAIVVHRWPKDPRAPRPERTRILDSVQYYVVGDGHEEDISVILSLMLRDCEPQSDEGVACPIQKPRGHAEVLCNH